MRFPFHPITTFFLIPQTNTSISAHHWNVFKYLKETEEQDRKPGGKMHIKAIGKVWGLNVIVDDVLDWAKWKTITNYADDPRWREKPERRR